MSIVTNIFIAFSMLTASLAALVVYNVCKKQSYITRCAASASLEQLKGIYALVEQVGTVRSAGYILARTNIRSNDRRCLVPIPKELPEFPWAGKVIEIAAANSFEFKFSNESISEPSLFGQVYHPLKVPRHAKDPLGKQRNSFRPSDYINRSPALLEALSLICPRYPAELLSYLLCVGGENFMFESINQLRIGTTPAWVQDSEVAKCDYCNNRMILVLQIPGILLMSKELQRGTFYLFGCAKHPQHIKSIGQFT